MSSGPRRALDGNDAMHVAIVMNGNGRWAARRGLNPTSGCFEGAIALRATVTAAAQSGIKTLTVYALRAADPRRARAEVEADASVVRSYLRAERENCQRRQIGVSLIGWREQLAALRLDPGLERSGTHSRMHLRIVIDYDAERTPSAAGAVELLIRAGGASSLGDFILWEAAHARLHTAACLWPDFSEHELQRALRDHPRGAAASRAFLALSRTATSRPVTEKELSRDGNPGTL